MPSAFVLQAAAFQREGNAEAYSLFHFPLHVSAARCICSPSNRLISYRNARSTRSRSDKRIITSTSSRFRNPMRLSLLRPPLLCCPLLLSIRRRRRRRRHRRLPLRCRRLTVTVTGRRAAAVYSCSRHRHLRLSSRTSSARRRPPPRRRPLWRTRTRPNTLRNRQFFSQRPVSRRRSRGRLLSSRVSRSHSKRNPVQSARPRARHQRSTRRSSSQCTRISR